MDEITEELQRIIEYLSVHTVADVEVAALELAYMAEGDIEVLVPQVFGIELAKGKREPPRGPWTEDEVFAALSDDEVATGVVRALKAWAEDQRLRVIGTTTKVPSLAWHLDALGTDYTFFLADTRHNDLWLYFWNLKNKPVTDASCRDVLVKALSAHFPIPPDRAEKQPSIPLAELADHTAFRAFTAAWDEVIKDVRAAEVSD